MAKSAVNVDAIPSSVFDAIPSVDVHAIPTVEVDAIPLTFNESTNQPVHRPDFLDKLTIADYRSILFMFIDTHNVFEKKDFLDLVRKEKDFLKKKFLCLCKEFPCRDALLIEIFGTMQKYDLLKFFGTCCHVFNKDKETFTQLSSQWKFLYAVCEQLIDDDVNYLKEKLLPEDTNTNFCCAEELICQAFLKGELEENNWKSKLADIFKSSHPVCSRFITSYKDSNLKYYPIRRPLKTAPCGIAVIMNHVKFDGNFPERPESNLDADALKKLWESFGFKTEIYKDLTSKEVNRVFEKLSREDHSNHDVFVACYLSHGDNGFVIAKDGVPIKLTDLTDRFADECRTLLWKPKLFFVQACQGQGIQTGVGGRTFFPQVPSLHPTTSSQVSITRHSLRSDVLLFNSSIEGFVSYREENGSWFIKALVSELEKHGEELTLENVLKKVLEEVTKKEGRIENTNIIKCKQTPIEHHTLRYELKLKKVL